MLPAEIEHIWKTKFGLGSILYILTRYLAFIEAPFLILYAFDVGYGHSPNAEMLCLRAYRVAAWLDTWGTIVANNILYLRTAAIWGWTTPTFVCVAVANMFFIPSSVYDLAITLRSMKFVPSPVASLFPCDVAFPVNRAVYNFASVILVESGVLVLTLYRRFRTWPEHPTPLLRTLFYDAILFFGCLCVLAILNVILYATPSLKDFYQLLVEMQYILTSVLTARIILHLRITGANPGANDGSVLLSDEYMKHASRAKFERAQNSDFSTSGTDNESEIFSIELQPRGSTQNRPRVGAKDYTVVNPYMI